MYAFPCTFIGPKLGSNVMFLCDFLYNQNLTSCMLKGRVLVMWGGGGAGMGMWIGVCGGGAGMGTWIGVFGTMSQVWCIRMGCLLDWLLRLVCSLSFQIRNGTRLGASFWATGMLRFGHVFVDHLNVVLPKSAEVSHHTHTAHSLEREKDRISILLPLAKAECTVKKFPSVLDLGDNYDSFLYRSLNRPNKTPSPNLATAID